MPLCTVCVIGGSYLNVSPGGELFKIVTGNRDRQQMLFFKAVVINILNCIY